MRLYCPTCRTMYEESKERYDSLNGQVPCRVCRTPLMLDEPAPTFDSGGDTEHMGQVFTVDDAGKTTVLEAPSLGGADLYGKTTMIDLAMISPAGDVPSTLTPSASPSNYASGGTPPNTGTGPYQSTADNVEAPTVVSQLAEAPVPQQQPYYPPQPSPAPMGGAPPAGENFHNEATFIFEVPSVPSPAPSAMPQHQPMPAAAPAAAASAQQAPPFAPSGMTQPAQQAPYKRVKRKVVIGGAAVQDAEQKTQALDISAFREIHAQGSSSSGQPEAMDQDGMVPVSPPANQQIIPHNPSGANPALPAHLHGSPPQQQQPMVINAAGALDEPSKGSKLPLILGLLVLLLVTAFFLMAFEVLPRPGFVPKLGGGGSGSVSSASDSEETSEPAVEIDHLLVGLREYVEPPIVSAGETPDGVAAGLAVMSSQTGSVYRWVSTPDSPQATQVDGDYIEAISEDVERVFVVFDRTTNADTFIETLDALLAAGHAPVLTGGSHLGSDSHFGYPASAVPGAPVLVQIDPRSVVVTRLDWSAPRVSCYRHSVPAELVSGAIDDAFADASPPFEVTVEVTSNLDLQAAYNLAQALYRPDLNMRFRAAQGFAAPAECAQ